MPSSVMIGQKWSVWSPSRRQWLLATVIDQEGGRATLKFDRRYDISVGDDNEKVDQGTMLAEPRLFRFVEA